MSSRETAADRAAAQVAAVRDSAGARLRLLAATYRGPTGDAPRHLPYRRAAMSFMAWQAHRGLLEPLDAPHPGSPWWRAVNERLLYDGCAAVCRAAGLPAGEPEERTWLWDAFVLEPTAQHWYRAHNATIVAGYLEHHDLAGKENRVERFFLNVVLLRVLYAHALVAAPSLALGRFAPTGRLLGDPRLGMTSAFLSLGRVLPDRYPLTGDLSAYLADEHGIGRTLDYAVIGPRLQRLYEWSADELHEPRLLGLVDQGNPSYVWPSSGSAVWRPPRMTWPARTLARLTAPR